LEELIAETPALGLTTLIEEEEEEEEEGFMSGEDRSQTNKTPATKNKSNAFSSKVFVFVFFFFFFFFSITKHLGSFVAVVAAH
jgi:hypothetical protein